MVGTLAGKRVAALSGRAHFYEGHDLRTVTFATRVIGTLGVKTLILTNAAGGINLTFKPGTLMLMDDHLNLMGSNPLVGANDERFGPRFPDMSEVYSTRLRQLAGDAARAQGLDAGARRLRRAARTELRNAGRDPLSADHRRRRRRDVDRARSDRRAPHGLEVLGISCITNMAAGVLPQPLVHDEVMEVARRVRGEFCALLEGIVERL